MRANAIQPGTVIPSSHDGMKPYRIVTDRGITGKRFGVIVTEKPLVGQWCHGPVSLDIASLMNSIERQEVIRLATVSTTELDQRMGRWKAP